MTITAITTEGIVLREIPFGDNDQIITLFTPEAGRLPLMVKRGRSPKRKAPLSVLTQAEIVYKPGRHDLGFANDIFIKKRYQEGWSSYRLFEVGTQLALMVLNSQLPGKPAPKLYALLTLYLHRLQDACSADAMEASFRLKILKHEGLAIGYDFCTTCDQPLNSGQLFGGEAFCSSHAPVGSVSCSSDDLRTLSILMHTLSIRELLDLKIPRHLCKVTQVLFDQSLDR